MRYLPSFGESSSAKGRGDRNIMKFAESLEDEVSQEGGIGGGIYDMLT